MDKSARMPHNKFGRTYPMKSDPSLHSHDANRETKADLYPLPPTDQLAPLLLDALPGMAFVARADRERTVEYASAGCQALLGFKYDHKHFSLATLIHPDDREPVLGVIKAAVAANHPFAVEFRVRHANGHWRTVWEQGRPARFGQRQTVQAQLLDVTQRVQREQARLATELRLLQTQKFFALNQLAGGVAHEFNNLVAGILGSAELAAMDLPEKHPAQETLRQIFEASNMARDFVHKLREFGQRPAPECRPVRLQPIIEECLQILRSVIPPKVEMQVRLDPECPKVNADPAQIQQAILDLCLHSWHGLADRRGRIDITLETAATVRVPAGQPSVLQPGPHVCLTVHDNSPGLEKSARENIFHPFRNRRANGKKNGLELFLVRETVQAHHGEIFVESEPGHGLAVHLYLPVAADLR